MNFKKTFIVGYIIYVIALIAIYFLLPVENVFIAILIVTIIFGVFNIVFANKFHHQKK